MACQYYDQCDKKDEESPTCKSYVDSNEYCGIAKRWEQK